MARSTWTLGGLLCTVLVLCSAQNWQTGSNNIGSNYGQGNQYGSQSTGYNSGNRYGSGSTQYGSGQQYGGVAGADSANFQPVYEWYKLDYNWQDEVSKMQALGNRRFIPENNAIAGIKVWRDRIFVTIPRWKEGVPVTIASVPNSMNSQPNASPRLDPFPNWQMQEIGNCTAFQFVQSMEIDTEGRMWIIDSGRTNIMDGNSPPSRCTPKLVIIDLNSVQYPPPNFGGQFPNQPGQPGYPNQQYPNQPGSYPNQQYPNNPNQQYPNSQYPNSNVNQQYPNSQYPNSNVNQQYPNSQYPNSNLNQQYPNSNINQQYPNNQYPNNQNQQYPNSQYPNQQNPNNPYGSQNQQYGSQNQQYGRSNQYGSTNQYGQGGQYNQYNQFNNTPRYDQFGNPLPGGIGGYPNQGFNNFGFLGSNFRVIKSYTFPSNVATQFGAYLNDIVLDNSNGWYAYITDHGDDPGIIVYSFREDRAWKVKDARSMRADPDVGFLSINNIDVELRGKNIDGIALSPEGTGGYERTLYFSPLGSYNLYSLSTSALKDPSLPSDVSNSVKDLGRKQSISDGMIMDNRGNLYFGLLGRNAIGVWNTNRGRFTDSQRVFAQDMRTLQWPDTFAIDDNGYMYVVSNRLQNYITGRVNTDEPNYRILKTRIGARSYLSRADASGGGIGGGIGGVGGYNQKSFRDGYNNYDTYWGWNTGAVSQATTGVIFVASILAYWFAR